MVDVYGRFWVVQEKEERRRCITGSGTRRARNTQSIKDNPIIDGLPVVVA